MASRGIWKGYLKLALVTCPVSLEPATTDNEKLRFHILNHRTGNRVVSQSIDSATHRAVEEDDLVKGYEKDQEQFVMLEDEELESVALPSVRTIDIETFAPRATIGWIWHDKPHFLVPTDQIGEEAYAVIRDAMAVTKTVGIAKLVLYRRERTVKIEPRGKGIVLWTLRFGSELRDDDSLPTPADRVDAKALKLFKSLIGEHTQEWDSGMVKDPVQERLIDIIAAKRTGKKKVAKEQATAPPAGNVINIMDALRRSLAKDEKAARRGR